jgi:hypothetical protein
MDLGLDHDELPAPAEKLFGHSAGFVGGGADLPVGNGDAVACEELFGLEFVEVHRFGSGE